MSSEKSPTKSGKQCETYPYPSCWQDDARVQVLLAPFRDRSVNSENYDSKMEFWKDTIREYCEIKGKANFCKHELQSNFTKGQRVPCCLDAVLDEMLRKKLIRLRKEYEYDPENSWSGWAINSFFKKPLSWGFDQIKLKLGAADKIQLGLVQFVHLDVLKKLCSDLQCVLIQSPYIGSIINYDVLRRDVCLRLNISEESLHICLRTLNVQRRIGIEYMPNTSEPQIHLVKIPSKEDYNINITETDKSIHHLQVTKTNLIQQIEDIESEIKDNENRARQYVKENKKLLAKTYLRKKRLLEKNHENRSLALHNIETILSNVHDAKFNGVILDAYKFGSKALQNALSAANLKYDNVDEIVSNVRESIDSHKEIQDTLATANFNDSLSSLADEDELEQELKDILGESSTKNSPVKNVIDKKNTISARVPQHIEITDAQLLDMLNGLEIEQNSPEANNSGGVLKSQGN